MSWGQNSPFPIDFARGPYHSSAVCDAVLGLNGQESCWVRGKMLNVALLPHAVGMENGFVLK